MILYLEDLSPRLARGVTACVKNCLHYNGYFHPTVGSQFHGVAKGTINIFLFRRGCFLGFDLGAFAKSGPYPAHTNNSNDNNGPNPPSAGALNPFFRFCRPQAIFFDSQILQPENSTVIFGGHETWSLELKPSSTHGF